MKRLIYPNYHIGVFDLNNVYNHYDENINFLFYIDDAGYYDCIKKERIYYHNNQKIYSNGEKYIFKKIETEDGDTGGRVREEKFYFIDMLHNENGPAIKRHDYPNKSRYFLYDIEFQKHEFIIFNLNKALNNTYINYEMEIYNNYEELITKCTSFDRLEKCITLIYENNLFNEKSYKDHWEYIHRMKFMSI